MRIALFLFTLSIGHLGISQNFLSWKFNDRYFSVSAGAGAVSYFGDLNAYNKLNGRIKLSNIGLEARLLNHFSARLEANYYTMEGRDSRAKDGSFEMQRNLSFESKNIEANLQVIYYLKSYSGDYFSRKTWDPYFGIGAGLTSYNPYTYLAGEQYFLRDLETEADKNYGKFALVIPVTAGIKFKVNDFTNLSLEVGYRFTTTDYLDDVSTVYPEESETFSVVDQLANRRDEIPTFNIDAYDALIPGAMRGDNSKADKYLFVLLKAEMFLPKNLLSSKKPKSRKSSVK